MSEKSEIFEITYRDYISRIAGMNLKQRADRLGASFTGNSLLIPFYGNSYRVSEAGVFDGDGNRANFAVSVVLCRYILQCPEQVPLNGQWVTYREFKDAGPLVGYFTANTHKTIENAFGGNPAALESAGKPLSGVPYAENPTCDLSLLFTMLPRIPVLLGFNDRDDEFPAQCTILFRESAEAYLDMESLSIAGTYLAGYLIKV
ncbi:MAG: DUF3786 domain-containing protein [Desulfobacteraceae bacterium]|nr:DUF3786 domain-containing protein [Desulfobacteraceae bacterium]